MKLLTALSIPAIFLAVNSQPAFLKGTPPASETVVPKPSAQVKSGNGIALIVKGLALNIDNIRFIKEPKATDYVTKANNKAAYAPSIIIAACNGIKLSRGMNPEAAMTRADFANSLLEGINSTGQYAVNMMWINIKDEKSFPAGGSSSAIQTLIKYNVVALENGNFRPKAYITPAEANKMVKQAAAFVKSHKTAVEAPANEEITAKVTPVNEEISRVILSRGTKPTSGYSITITSIEFVGETAKVHYKLINPAKDGFNTQVITEPKVETFVPAKYKVTLKKDE